MRKVGEDCYQWGNQKVYCGAGAYEKAVAQGEAIRATGWKEAEFEAPYQPDQTMQDYTLSELTTSSAISGYQPYKYSASHGAESEESEFYAGIPIYEINSLEELREVLTDEDFHTKNDAYWLDYNERKARPHSNPLTETHLFRINFSGIYALRSIKGPSKVLFGTNLLQSATNTHTGQFSSYQTYLSPPMEKIRATLPNKGHSGGRGILSAYGPYTSLMSIPQETPFTNSNNIIFDLEGVVFGYHHYAIPNPDGSIQDLSMVGEIEIIGGVPEKNVVYQDFVPKNVLTLEPVRVDQRHDNEKSFNYLGVANIRDERGKWVSNLDPVLQERDAKLRKIVKNSGPWGKKYYAPEELENLTVSELRELWRVGRHLKGTGKKKQELIDDLTDDTTDEDFIEYWNQFAAEDNYEATYGKRQAAIRRRLKKKIKAQNVRGTAAGEWSARKSQLLKEKYEAACERANIRPYKGKKTQSQKNLSNWSKQDWRTASGRKSSVTGEPYFPAKAVEALKKKGLYAKARRQKRAATKAGKQNARYSDDIRKVVKRFRAEDDAPEFWQVIETDEGSALYRKIIDLTYNQVWRLLELIDDLNRMTKHHALTKFGANEVEIWVYTHDKNSITAKDYHWTEDFNEMFETVDWKHFKVEEMPDWDDIEWKDDYISPQKGPEDWGEDVEWEAENAKTTSSVVFVHPRSGKIGLQLRSSRVNEPDTWAAVGGYIDDGEHPHRAAYREIEEELGIDLRAHGLKLVSNDYPHFIYRMDVPVMFRPFLNWESRDFAWKHPSEWKAMGNIHPELKPILQARIFGAEEKDKEKEKAKLISLNMVDETDPSIGRNIDEQLAWQLKGYSKINEEGNIGCPECGSVDLFAREFTDKGVKWNCWDCMYSRKIETLKSQKDITLEKFGLVFPCAKCGKDIKAFNRYSLIQHQRKCEGKK